MKYLKLMRIKHYLKNGLVVLPLIFSGFMLNKDYLIKVVVAFMAFSLTASIVYIINDIKDAPKDRLHPVKKNRPIASGEVSVLSACILALLLLVIIVLMLYMTGILFNYGSLILLVYLILNILYSMGLKNIPLVDITILAFGFVLRVIYGGLVIDVPISNWLFLTILSASFYMALGKRRNELDKVGDGNTRAVLKYYNRDFLDKNMYMFLSLSIVFYALWATMGIDVSLFKYSVVFVILILMKYSMNVEMGGYGDPVDVILNDKILLGIGIIYVIFTLTVLYL